MYICMHVVAGYVPCSVFVCTCIYACVCVMGGDTFMRIDYVVTLQVCTPSCIHMHIYIHVYIRIHIFMYTYAYIYIHVCMISFNSLHMYSNRHT